MFPFETGNWLNLFFPHWELVETFVPIFGNWFKKRIPLVGIGWLFSCPKQRKWENWNAIRSPVRWSLMLILGTMVLLTGNQHYEHSCHRHAWHGRCLWHENKITRISISIWHMTYDLWHMRAKQTITFELTHENKSSCDSDRDRHRNRHRQLHEL